MIEEDAINNDDQPIKEKQHVQGKTPDAESIDANSPKNTNSETFTVNEPPVTSNEKITAMEVHHHPHVEKKDFKEYFLEFVMIFIAVTLGFFAESIREYISDNAKEKEYIESWCRTSGLTSRFCHKTYPPCNLAFP